MPRHARHCIAGIPMHIVHRGNNRSACFRGDRDYRVYLRFLGNRSREMGCAVHAYVLMTNHVHLLVTPSCVESPAGMMKLLAQEYAQYVNRNYSRTGSLWEGRFHSSLVESGDYLLRCQRYIELNPVRAGMVRLPEDHPWSSFRGNVGLVEDALLEPHPTLLAMGETVDERRIAYREFVAFPAPQGEAGRIRNAVNGGFVLGGFAFTAGMKAQLGATAARVRAPRAKAKEP